MNPVTEEQATAPDAGITNEIGDVNAEFSPDSADAELRAVALIRRGLQASPELRDGLRTTLAMGFTVALGRLVIPVLIERTIDHGIGPGSGGGTAAEGGVDVGYVLRAAAIAAVVIVAGAGISWLVQRRLVLQAELAIANLRVRTFNRIHQFSIADHNDTRKGLLVSRVTSDPETLARFAQWGLYIWSIQPVVVFGVLLVLAFYSWQLALIVLLVHLPAIPVFRFLQRRQIAIYDAYRNRVSDMLAAYSEMVSGASVVRAYGAEGRFREELNTVVERRYRTRIRANRYVAGLFVIGDLFGAAAMVAILAVGLWQRQAWGLHAGELVAALFLTNLLREPIAEISEVLDQTQVAAASWNKILNVLDHPIDVKEPPAGQALALPRGPLSIEADHVDFAYRGGDRALIDVSVSIPAGINVAVVGETGSGKTTFAKLLCRLADPTAGSIRLSGVELSRVSADSRIHSVRMVPQDGFLFDATIAENVSFGADHATEDMILAAFDRLGLGWWVEKQGLHARVGERGENLSVGERQLVALARAQLADPGLLILDEATSAVDPETDQALTNALRRLAEGRTMLSIAHRLSTAEAADLVLVFDQSRLVGVGSHQDLLAQGGVYHGLYQAWLGNTRSATSSAGHDPDR
ncbi:MAG: ABC transporter ATP-binding protein/permease [Acidimicrobiia bacterium]|nr:ABC transporter ATP-binding protein/permease [Acidimicrobiia bacterium]